MNLKAAYLLFIALGLVKAALFAGIVRWCLKNDLAAQGEGGDDGGHNTSPEPYNPPSSDQKWQIRERESLSV